MNTAIRIERSDHDDGRILALLDAAGLDFMVERVNGLWRVETELRETTEGYSCTGSSLADALAQLTTVLELELELDVAGDELVDADERIPYVLDEPVEFAAPLAFDDPEHYRAYLSTELGGRFIEEIAE